MPIFATEFPVSEKMTHEKFCEIVKNWLIHNRNSQFKNEDFYADDKDFFQKTGTGKLELPKETLSYISTDNDTNFSGISIQYYKNENNITYTTELTFSHNKRDGCKWFGCRINNSTKTINTNLPPINKPKIIHDILDNVGGGVLVLPVKHTPHY